MTHKQVKFGKGKRSREVKPEVKPVEEEYESADRRAVVLDSDNVDGLARAMLIKRFVNSPEYHYDKREFASYYCAPTGSIEPPHSITSHTNPVYISKALRVIPTYPSHIQVPEWCYRHDRQPPPQYSQEVEMMNHNYVCRCLECTSPDCPARDTSQSISRVVKDNIMIFCDKSSMTRNFNDAGCGCTPTPSSVTCDTSMMHVRDPKGKVKFFAMNHKHDTYTPAPILKNCYTDSDPVNSNSWTQSQDEYDEYDPPKPKTMKCCFREDETRKNIYNEGISDRACEFPSYHSYPRGKRRPRAPCSASPGNSRATVLSERGSDSEVNIPHAHRHSRYHKHCADEPMPMVFVQNKFRAPSKQPIPVFSPTMPACSRTPPRLRTPPRPMTPLAPNTPCCSGKQNKPKQRTIKLPKKLLTSEKLVAPKK